MEMYQTVPFLDTKSSCNWNRAGAADYKADKNGSFSDALEQELSQGETVQNGSGPQKDEAHVEPGQEKEAASVTAVPWMIQNPLMQQTAASHAATAEPVQLSEEGQPQQTLLELNLPGIEGAAEKGRETGIKVQTGDLIQTEPELPRAAKGNMQQGEINAADTLKSPADETAKTEAKPPAAAERDTTLLKPVNEQAEQEPGKDSWMPELIQTDRTAETGRTVSFQTPERVQTAGNVDVTDVKAGIQKLAESMNKQMAGGRTEFEIWLEPANLGKLAIKVAYESGRAMISITCLNEKTMELISQNAKNLGNILEQHTGTDTVVVIDQPETDYLKQKADQQSQNSYSGEEQQKKQEEDSDEDSRSFLQQLRLGLM